MKPAFYVIVAHGLNLKPERMKSFSKLIETLNGVADYISFEGHEKSQLVKYNKIEHNDWLNNIGNAFNNYKKTGSETPLFFIGYSLGALAGLVYLQKDTEFQKHLKKMVLFAPAIETKKYLNFIYKYIKFPKLIVPSLSAPSYRVHPFTSLKMNNEIFKLIENLKAGDLTKINIPALVFLNSRDELIDYKSTKVFVKNNNLTNWSINEVLPSRKPFDFMAQHLFIDERSAGNATWSKIENQLQEFLMGFSNSGASHDFKQNLCWTLMNSALNWLWCS